MKTIGTTVRSIPYFVIIDTVGIFLTVIDVPGVTAVGPPCVIAKANRLRIIRFEETQKRRLRRRAASSTVIRKFFVENHAREGMQGSGENQDNHPCE